MTGWATGDHLGIDLPADAAALAAGGAAWLTRAFRAAGSLGPDGQVARIAHLDPCPGGSTGAKLLLTVNYAGKASGLPRDLFVKFSRDFADPIRDRGRDQLEPEVRFALLSRDPAFPIPVPRCLYADYERASGTGVIVTARIPFGEHGVEPPREKCRDHEMADPIGHYRALVSANARLAGAHRAGRLGDAVERSFPFDPAAAIASDPIRYDAAQLRRRVDRFAAFAAEAPQLLPAAIRDPGFLGRLGDEAALFKAGEGAIKRHLVADPDLIALVHWNANIDNGWFWRDAAGELRCGLFDWGRVGQMNVALALWGGLSAAEPAMLDRHLDELLALFADTYAQAGGPAVLPATLRDHFCLYVATMGLAWLMDAPALIRADVPDMARARDRHDPCLDAGERPRTQLHMLTNMLGLWQRLDFAAVLRRSGLA